MTAAALDACLCLLLISAAAVTVTSVPASPDLADADRADAVAETLAATTADVPYSLEPSPNAPPDANGAYERVAHGTLASLLADAAVRTVRVDGEPLTRTNAGFAASVREAVADRLPPRTRVVVRWRPYPDAHLGREFVVGEAPPESADVHAATVRAPSGVDAPEAAGAAAEAGGYAALARALANALVDGILPPEKARLALADDAPLDVLVRHRYRRVSDRYGVDTTAAVERGDTAEANRQLAAAMANRVADDLRAGTESPTEAVERLSVDTVEISVRTWSP